MRWFIVGFALCALVGCDPPERKVPDMEPLPERTKDDLVTDLTPQARQARRLEMAKQAVQVSPTGKVPDDFPLPLFLGTIVERAVRLEAEAGPTIQVTFRNTAAGPVTVAGFYKAELEKQGFTVEQRDIGDPPTVVKLVAEKGQLDFTANIAVIPPEGGCGGALTLSPKPDKG